MGMDEIDQVIARAKRFGIELTHSDFEWLDEAGAWCIDGMDPADWLAAQVLD